MRVMELSPVQIDRVTWRSHLKAVEEAQVIELVNPPLKEKKQFIEANTKPVDIFHLKDECVVPVFSKDNEITISHPNFIETVFEAASKVFPNERINPPDIRVSHLIKGRTPDAVNKRVDELLDEDKTLYYERMAFVIDIPTIHEDINGNQLMLSVGGVRAYNQENLYSKKTFEKFKVFIGFKNLVCCNMCISTDGLKEEMKAMNETDLLKQITLLFQLYNAEKHLNLMNSLKNISLTEHQFAQLAGKSRLYHYLPLKEKKLLPELEFTDSHLNIIARNYYKDKDFCKGGNELILLWNVYNLFTSANKSSYIDTFLKRAVNATDFLSGVSEALRGNSRYKWFVE